MRRITGLVILLAVAGLPAERPLNADALPPGYVLGKFSVFKEKESDHKFANTGLAYDTKRHWLLIGNGTRVEFYTKSGERARPALVLDSLGITVLQGVAYDSSDDTIWLWSIRDYGATNAQAMIWHCDLEGRSLDEPFRFEPGPNAPGMLSYDADTDSLWANPYSSPVLHRISCETRTVVERLEPGPGLVNSEGIGVDPFDGTFWLLNSRWLYHVKKDGERYTLIESYPNPSVNCSEDRVILQALDRLAVEGTDWAFASLGGSSGTITRASGGLLTAPPRLKLRRQLIVTGSEYNDGEYDKLAIDDRVLTMKTRDGSPVRDEPAGRPVAVSFPVPGSDEGVAVDPTDHTVWINTDTDKGGNWIPGCNRCWHLDPLGVATNR